MDDLIRVLKNACDKRLYNPYCIDDANHIDNIFIWKLIKCYLQNCKKNDHELWYKVPIEIAKVYMMTNSARDESEIFNYMIEYAKRNTKNENQYVDMLNNLKKYIKLPYVGVHYLHNNIKPLGLYPNEDIYEALLYANSPDIFSNRENEYKFIKRKKWL